MATKNTAFGGKITNALLKNAKRVAFVGIGGIGMYSIAQILLTNGQKVFGQDAQNNIHIDQLWEKGVAVFTHNEALPLEAGDVVVYTVAVPFDHPTLVLAEKMNIPLLSRADALAGLMEEHSSKIAVAGMHGKSTATAILGHIIAQADLDPAVVCGADMVKEAAPYRIGQGPFVFEACEYMRSFLSFSPDLALLLNMEWEHVDCYPTEKEVEQAFAAFVMQSKETVLCYDCPSLRPFSKGKPALFYSVLDKGADVYGGDIQAEKGGYRFTLYRNKIPQADILLPLRGKMNVSNAVGAAAAGLQLGLPIGVIAESLSKEKGVRRRLEQKGFLRGAPVLDDYAHHHTEVFASLSALRQETRGKLFCVFESHTYSRTKAFLFELAKALNTADRILVANIYPAREADNQGMSGEVLAKAIGEKGLYCPCYEDIAAFLLTHVREEDAVVVMGAGHIDRLFSHIPLTATPF